MIVGTEVERTPPDSSIPNSDYLSRSPELVTTRFAVRFAKNFNRAPSD